MKLPQKLTDPRQTKHQKLYNTVNELIDFLMVNGKTNSVEKWEQPCGGCGHHDTINKTLLASPQWKRWYEHQTGSVDDGKRYDVDESQELGIMSAAHFQDFIDFLLKEERDSEDTQEHMTIKAWAVLQKDQFSHVTLHKEEADTWETCRIVPCTITYVL
jgi:hypothetical protein